MTTEAPIKYTLSQFYDISISGFQFEIPESTFDTINYLCSQVNSACLTSRMFVKQVNIQNSTAASANNAPILDKKNKRRNRNRGNECVDDEDWSSLRTFQKTVIEQKTGIDGELDQIRLYLNKLTDKTYLDLRDKITTTINQMNLTNDEDKDRVGTVIYDLCSSTKFYSNIFADLFAELVASYDWLRVLFDNKYAALLELYETITYVDSDVDYDGFCEMNKINEKRRATTMFYVSLVKNGFINEDIIIRTISNILVRIHNDKSNVNQKHINDELTEIVCILFDKQLLAKNAEFKRIESLIHDLSTKSAKEYGGLSSKTIFKYMDMIDA